MCGFSGRFRTDPASATVATTHGAMRAFTPTRRHADLFAEALAKEDTPIRYFPALLSIPLILSILFVPSIAPAQWQPPAALRRVPIKYDCKKTQHRVGAALQPNPFFWNGAIYLCPERMHAIDARHPGASRFFLVHEFGHLALHTEDEAAADEWAAKQLAAIPEERETLRAVLLHFVDDANVYDPLYGNGLDRAIRIAKAARLPNSERPPQLRTVVLSK
jgi:hypothetical protein